MTTAVADPAARDWRQTLVDRPAVALSGVLLLLYVVTGLVAPGMFTPNGVRSTLLLACPLAILAASQTLCMLTGGIDLSTVMTANFAAYVAANQSGQGPLVALSLALLVGLAVGTVNGVGVGVFKVNPLIMTLGMASVLLGVVTVGLVGDGFLSGSTRILPISAVMIGDSPMDGSSSSSSFGRLIRARAMASICCSPPESEPARWRPRSCKIGKC